MTTIAHLLGEAFAVGVLFELSKDMNMTRAFQSVSAIVLSMSIFSYLLVSEPNIKMKVEYSGNLD